MSSNLDAALQKLTADEDVSPLVVGEVDLPPGTYLPDTLERRAEKCKSKPVNTIYHKKKAVKTRLETLVGLIRGAKFESNFIINLDVLARRILRDLWERVEQLPPTDALIVYFVQDVKTGHLVVYACTRVMDALSDRPEFATPVALLRQRIDEQTKDDAAFAMVDTNYQKLNGGIVLPLAQWLPRSNSNLGSVGSASSSGCSSPTSSIGGSSSGLAIALTPRVHSKNPTMTRLLPWSIIKGFAQTEAVANIFEAYAESDDTPHTGKEMYIFADCTVIALVRSLLHNERYLAHACQPSSPIKRRRDGAESHPEATADEHTSVTKTLTEYIQFVHAHASDLHTDDSVAIATLIERHLQQLLPCAREYLRDSEFEGF